MTCHIQIWVIINIIVRYFDSRYFWSHLYIRIFRNKLNQIWQRTRICIPITTTIILQTCNLQILGFDDLKVVADPQTYRAEVWKNKRPLDGVCITANINPAKEDNGFDESGWIQNYENGLRNNILTTDLIVPLHKHFVENQPTPKNLDRAHVVTLYINSPIWMNKYFWHFYQNKGAGLLFLASILTDVQSPQLISFLFFSLSAIVLFALVWKVSNRNLSWSLLAVAVYFSSGMLFLEFQKLHVIVGSFIIFTAFVAGRFPTLPPGELRLWLYVQIIVLSALTIMSPLSAVFNGHKCLFQKGRQRHMAF